ncbi:MAG: hypothetical protein D6705_13195 [Deltaproteobacteria bacterium]|nr:MAG: hypothetical protein D6705_13195 [Deltaproteobacteria bacterium]
MVRSLAALALAVGICAEAHAAPSTAEPGGDAAPPSEATDENPYLDSPDATAPPGQDFGPFFVGPPASETRFPASVRKGHRLAPLLSVRDGLFCFVEDAHCVASLLASADVGIGMAVIGDNGPDLPYAQLTFRGGVTLRPMTLRRRRFHPWAVGLAGSYSVGTGGIRLQSDDVVETERTQAVRIALVNQLWLWHRPHAFHIDASVGAVRSGVLGPDEKIHDLWGTHAELALGFGGWGALVVSGDFLDEDTRIVFGFRTHALVGGPLFGLTALGLWAGGVL